MRRNGWAKQSTGRSGRSDLWGLFDWYRESLKTVLDGRIRSAFGVICMRRGSCVVCWALLKPEVMMQRMEGYVFDQKDHLATLIDGLAVQNRP